MGTVCAVCISEKKGTQKINVHSGTLIAEHGLEGDAHAGSWHRQVSLISKEKIEAFKTHESIKDGESGKCKQNDCEKHSSIIIADGAFGENLIVSGIDFRTLPLGTRLGCGKIELEITQIGKECHSRCAIFDAMGDCIMPKEGVFAKVITGGTINEGDKMTVLLRATVVTLSDKGFTREREDESGKIAAEILLLNGFTVTDHILLPDDFESIKKKLAELCDSGTANLIVTTGGTGFSKRDVTPEATLAVCERTVPGIPEAMRYASLNITKRTMLSRAVAGIRGETLVVNLPGSPKAVRENLEYIASELRHGVEILMGSAIECAR